MTGPANLGPIRRDRTRGAPKETAAQRKDRMFDLALHAFSTASEFKEMYPNGKDGKFSTFKAYKAEFEIVKSKNTHETDCLHTAIAILSRSETHPGAAHRAGVFLDRKRHLARFNESA